MVGTVWKRKIPKAFHDGVDKSLTQIYPGGGKCVLMTRDGWLPYVLVWLAVGSNVACIAHESFHAADMILRERGLTLTDSSDEAYAYLVGFFAREMDNVMHGRNVR